MKDQQLSTTENFIYLEESKIFEVFKKRNQSISDEFFELDLDTKKVTKLSSEGIPALRSHSTCGYEGKIYIYGGLKADGNKSKEIYAFDIKTSKWSILKLKGDSLGDLSSAQMIGVSKKLFICGGMDSFNIRKVEVYFIDLFTNQTKKITPKLVVERYGGKLFKIDEDTILLSGGFEKFGTYSDTFWMFDMEKENWYKAIFENQPKISNQFTVYDALKNQLFTVQKSSLYYCPLPRKGIFSFYLNPEFSDFNVSLGEGLNIPSHKAILSQGSALVEKLKGTEMDWSSYGASSGMKVLKYLYGKSIKCDPDEIIPLIYMSRDFEIPSLEIHCVSQLSSLTPEGVLTVLGQNEDYIRNVKKQRYFVGDFLKTWCLEYYQKNLDLFDSKLIYDSIQKLDEDLRIEMITLPTLEQAESIIPKETPRFEAVYNHLSQLSKKELFCDFTLSCEGLSLPSHKIVFGDLEFFASKLKQTDKIEFKDESSNTIRLYHQLNYDPGLDIEDKLIYISKFSEKYNLKLGTAPFKAVQFTTLGSSGRTGPTSTNGYNNTNLAGEVTLKNGIQIWRVPKTRVYKITAAGATGGTGDRLAPKPGKGAIVSGEFKLRAGTLLHIVVGQRGGNGSSTSNSAGGGGGGTFIVEEGITPLLIAGGGHGDNWRSWTVNKK
jgi:hypothetical protein